ncbi:hypothetical protein CUMW_256150 [Citrus unshiu]|uniref:Uncharacterized protein n=1 Tax=Citrus unshiu TaxID=55188 RepID=A0A2H5QRZ1_CITUN|nr:hypothetical protein CUMW_256150 [Citrus unshiu]
MAGLSTIGHLESSRLWDHDLPPSSHVGGHRRHRWTHREVRSPLTGRGNSEDPQTRINTRTLLILSLDYVTIDSRWGCGMSHFKLVSEHDFRFFRLYCRTIMIRRSNRCGRDRGRTRLVVGLTPGDVPVGENDPVNEGIIESSTHEVVQQAPRNAPNIQQSIDRLAQIVTTMTHPHVGHVNTIERVRSLEAKSFNGSGDPPEVESWLIK